MEIIYSVMILNVIVFLFSEAHGNYQIRFLLLEIIS